VPTSDDLNASTVVSSTESEVNTRSTDSKASAQHDSDEIREHEGNTGSMVMAPTAESEAVPSDSPLQEQVEPADTDTQHQAVATEGVSQHEYKPADAVEVISTETMSWYKAEPFDDNLQQELQLQSTVTTGQLPCEAVPTDTALQHQAPPTDDELEEKVVPSNDELKLEALPSDAVSQLKAAPDSTVLQDEAVPNDAALKHDSTFDDEANTVAKSEVLSCPSDDSRDYFEEHDTRISDSDSVMSADEHNEDRLQETEYDSRNVDISETKAGLELTASSKPGTLDDLAGESPVVFEAAGQTLHSVAAAGAVNIACDSDGLNEQNSQDIDSRSASQEMNEECPSTDAGNSHTFPASVLYESHWINKSQNGAKI